MKRQILILIMSFILMLLPFSQMCFAQENIDPQRESSLTLYYRYNNEPFEELGIKTYRVAQVDEFGNYTLTGVFADYPISISGVSSQTEWKQISSTLASYTIADGIVPDYSGETDGDGMVKFSNILPGMYLTLSVSEKSGERVVIFENFMTVVPRLDQDGRYDYHGVAYPKYSSYIPEPEEAEYKVVKQWKDMGYEEKRPEYVDVDIFKDGSLWSTVKLSSENNWSFSWKALDKKHNWTAVERNVPEDYTVTIVNDGYTVILTNDYKLDNENPPQTGEMFIMWPHILAMGLSGGVIMLLAIWRKRIEG